MNAPRPAPARRAEAISANRAPADPARLRAIGKAAIRALHGELALHPKPGLVSVIDAGAHVDMDATTFFRSLFALRGYFAAIASAGAADAPFAALRDLGLRAEAAMLAATGGVNTHRGAIFILGLVCAAAGVTCAQEGTPSPERLAATIRDRFGLALERSPRDPGSHGARVEQRHGVAGARGEAIAGLPSVVRIALPALRAARRAGAPESRARLAAFFALLACVDDTNLLHRGGAAGQAFARAAARDFLAGGGAQAPDAVPRAEAIHRAFVARGLSPGGCADLFAATLLVDALDGGAA